jgi:hypothetical protein
MPDVLTALVAFGAEHRGAATLMAAGTRLMN